MFTLAATMPNGCWNPWNCFSVVVLADDGNMDTLSTNDVQVVHTLLASVLLRRTLPEVSGEYVIKPLHHELRVVEPRMVSKVFLKWFKEDAARAVAEVSCHKLDAEKGCIMDRFCTSCKHDRHNSVRQAIVAASLYRFPSVQAIGSSGDLMQAPGHYTVLAICGS